MYTARSKRLKHFRGDLFIFCYFKVHAFSLLEPRYDQFTSCLASYICAATQRLSSTNHVVKMELGKCMVTFMKIKGALGDLCTVFKARHPLWLLCAQFHRLEMPE